jgi:hypothetical protein
VPIAINCRRAIHRFDSANSVTSCAVFFISPRNLTPDGLLAFLRALTDADGAGRPQKELDCAGG